MRKILIPAVTVLIASLLVLAIPTEAEGAIYEDTVRLHILANSDSEEDQALKIAVRDAILLEFGELLTCEKNAEEAEERLTELLPKIRESAERTVRAAGYSYAVSVSLGKEWYETREYEDFTLPRGEYTSLKIMIGEAEGKNWWCVMYPPLCLGASVESASVAYSEEETRLVTNGRMKVKFKTLELISGLFA